MDKSNSAGASDPNTSDPNTSPPPQYSANDPHQPQESQHQQPQTSQEHQQSQPQSQEQQSQEQQSQEQQPQQQPQEQNVHPELRVSSPEVYHVHPAPWQTPQSTGFINPDSNIFGGHPSSQPPLQHQQTGSDQGYAQTPQQSYSQTQTPMQSYDQYPQQTHPPQQQNYQQHPQQSYQQNLQHQSYQQQPQPGFQQHPHQLGQQYSQQSHHSASGQNANAGLGQPQQAYYPPGSEHKPFDQQPIQLQTQSHVSNMSHGQTRVVPVQTLMRDSAPVYCPLCGQSGMTATSQVVGNFTHAAAGILCFLVCLGCIPYCIESMKDVDHKCSNCGVLLAVWHRSGRTDVRVH